MEGAFVAMLWDYCVERFFPGGYFVRRTPISGEVSPNPSPTPPADPWLRRPPLGRPSASHGTTRAPPDQCRPARPILRRFASSDPSCRSGCLSGDQPVSQGGLPLGLSRVSPIFAALQTGRAPSLDRPHPHARRSARFHAGISPFLIEEGIKHCGAASAGVDASC